MADPAPDDDDRPGTKWPDGRAYTYEEYMEWRRSLFEEDGEEDE